MNQKELLIEKLGAARARMQRIVARARTEQQIYPKWRIKEVIDHLTGWDDSSIASIEAFIQGKEPPTPAARGIDVYNESTVEEREALDLTHSLEEWEVTRKQLNELIRQFPDDKLNTPFIFAWGYSGTLEQLLVIFIDHEEEHAEEIEKILNAQQAG